MRYNRYIPRFVALLVMVSLAASLFTGCGQDNTLVFSGTIESTQVEVNSEVAGKVIDLFKEEGTLVRKGEVIAGLDPSVQELAVKQQEAIVNLKKARLDELKAGSRAEQIRQAEASVKAAKAKLDELKAGTRPEQLRQAQAAVDTAKAGVSTATINYEYWKDKYDAAKNAANEGKLTSMELADVQLKVDTAGQQLLTAKEQLKSAQAQYSLLKNGPASQAVQAAQAGYEQALAQLDLTKKGATSQTIQASEADLSQSEAALEQSRLILSKFQIKSPSDGTLILRNVNIGDMVNTGASVATVSDLSDLWVSIYIPQKHLQRVKLNQTIDVKTSFLKDTAIKGKIVYISSTGEFTPKNVETTEAKENTVFKVKVKLLDHIDALKPGMTVEAGIPKV